MSNKNRNSGSISVWKKELGPSLSDIFLKKDIITNIKTSSDEKNDKDDIYFKYKKSNSTNVASAILNKENSINAQNKFTDFIARDTFIYDQNITCFPNYMHKSSLGIKKKIDICDVIIEVRDARLPFTSTNEFMIDNIKKKVQNNSNKKYIVVLNKVDLVSKKIALKAKSLIEEQTNNTICLLTSAKNNKNISKIRDICKQIKPKFKSFGIFAIVLGLPNVGKSSIINSFKNITYNLSKYGHKNNKIAYEVNGKHVKTNVLAGTTKIIEQYKVSNNPLLYLIDTPGIYLPKMNDKEITLKLSAIGNTLEYKYDHMYVGDYVLFILNKYKYYNYVKLLGLQYPTNDIRYVSNIIATKLNLLRNYTYLDINGGCRYFIDMFKLGLLGHVCLDTVPNKEDFVTYFDFKSEEPLATHLQTNPAPF
uniref:G domain-containing protein n=1 Tax=Piliocolobus tephrosceles TaxID=591936 RepID=A0A8C9HA71_9PRIM